MPNMNCYAAWVNHSSYQIPIYSGLITRPGGSAGAGGTQIGTIYPNEFYCTVPRDSTAQNVDYAKIYYRNSNHVAAYGYIEPQPGGIMTGYEPWYELQSHYINYNSNGSSLVTVQTEVIDGVSYSVFTVKEAVTMRYPSGVYLGTLSVGDKLATNVPQTGSSYNGHMLFYKLKKVGTSNWVTICTSGYAFVDLGLGIGSEPNTRAIW